jgi:hypothetical protein
MVTVRQLIDSILADKPSEEVEANLYSARLHINTALREISKVDEMGGGK